VTKRVLLDEGVPRHLAKPLDEAGYRTVPYPNSWKQLKNGELLARAEAEGFDVLVTNDKNIYAQQNLRGRRLAIVVLPTNLRRQIMERAAAVVDTIGRIKTGQYVTIEADGHRSVIDSGNPDLDPGEMPPLAPFDLK
jgi:predicted nuclease of predicted toxin-antitoxin system